MKCPACSHENPDDAVHCALCGRPLASTESASSVTVKLSKVAIVSAVCALVSWGCCVPGIIAELDPFVLDPERDVPGMFGVLAFLAAGVGFLAGVFGLIDIGVSGGRRTGYGFAVIGMTAPAVFVLVAIYAPAISGSKHLSSHVTCGTNLSGMGKAMLIYANDYGDRLPVAGGDGTVWGPGLGDWTAADDALAFGLDPNGAGGQATISSSLYLLVKYAGVSPKSFVCKGDRQTKEFKPATSSQTCGTSARILRSIAATRITSPMVDTH